jgi:hypothetical protein
MPQYKVLRTDDFTGGLNLRADPFQLAENESPDLLNVDVDPLGGFSIRGGFERLNTAAIGSIGAGAFTAEKLFNWATASPQLLVAANSKVFFGTGATFTDTTITTTSAEGASFASWSGTASVVYVACGVGSSQMAKWDGAARTLLTASGAGQWQDSFASPTGTHMPRADHVSTHVDRMWVASTFEGGVAYPNRVRFSHPNFPESWRATDFIDIVDGGSGITALVPFGGALMVFKRNSIHAIYGYDTDTFQVVTLTTALGVPTSHCVAATERGVYLFHWPEGLFLYDGEGFADIFAKLRPIITSGLVNSAAIDKIWVGHTNNRVWVSVPQGSATTSSHTYVFDPTTGAWTVYQCSCGSGLAAVTDFVSSTGAKFYLALHPTQPFVLQVDRQNVFQDNIAGTPSSYVSYYTTRWHDAGVVSAKKMWRRPDLVVTQPSSTTTLMVQVYHNWEEASVRRTHLVTIPANAGASLQWNPVAVEPDVNPGWGEASWGAEATGAQFVRGSNLGLARAIQLKISGPGGARWGVNSISYKYVPRRVR